MISNKVIKGQYYTTVNPFVGSAFDLWNKSRPHNCKILEPFAGAGNLFQFISGDWVGYDIEPRHQDIIQRDTIKNFPKGFSVCITNPPYLAKNSLSRKLGDNKKNNIFFKYEDLYIDCLDVMLSNCDYIAAIIPSTFYGTKLFRDRLMCWDKIDKVLFSDTTNPVGTAYFGPNTYTTKLFVNGDEIFIPENTSGKLNLSFNVEHGNYVLNAIDNTNDDSIFISPVSDSFNCDKFLKHTSRNYVLFYSPVQLDVNMVNEEIVKWRKATKDFELTAFKSPMKCGKYRKRMSFSNLKTLLINIGYKE